MAALFVIVKKKKKKMSSDSRLNIKDVNTFNRIQE